MTASPTTETPAEQPTFDVLPLSADVRRAVDKMGYRFPTPVQRAVFEPAAEGRDLLVQARTGTGKTAAFALPIIDRIVRSSERAPQALVLCPTRELALQVSREVEQIGQFRGTSIAAIYGGAPMTRQIAALQAGAQVVVGTPGRVLDHLRQKTLQPSGIRVLVLDEADEMLSMGFAQELHAIVELLPRPRQGMLFSATMPPDIQRLAHTQLRDAELISLSSDQVGALEVAHYIYVMHGMDKVSQLIRILEVEDPESALIFCNTRDETQRVAEALKARGFDADWLNGDLPQVDRERVMSATREGRLRFLVATDIAARGIDVSHLTHVINHDFPETAEQYVHRTGRTGRAGRTGTAISIVGPKDIGSLYLLRLTYKIRPIERQLPTAGELKTRAEMDVVELFVEAFAGRSIHPDDLSLTRRLLTHDDAEQIVAGLLRDHLGARGADAASDAAEARRARNPAPRRADVQTAQPAQGTPSYAAWEPPKEEDDERPIFVEDGPPPSDVHGGTRIAGADEGQRDFVELFVNVGRRERLRPADLQRLLEEKGVPAQEMGRIRMRDRATYISVRNGAFARAVSALAGQVIGGRTVVAELARGRANLGKPEQA